jgi:hypothetical protein
MAERNVHVDHVTIWALDSVLCTRAQAALSVLIAQDERILACR